MDNKTPADLAHEAALVEFESLFTWFDYEMRTATSQDVSDLVIRLFKAKIVAWYSRGVQPVQTYPVVPPPAPPASLLSAWRDYSGCAVRFLAGTGVQAAFVRENLDDTFHWQLEIGNSRYSGEAKSQDGAKAAADACFASIPVVGAKLQPWRRNEIDGSYERNVASLAGTNIRKARVYEIGGRWGADFFFVPDDNSYTAEDVKSVVDSILWDAAWAFEDVPSLERGRALLEKQKADAIAALEKIQVSGFPSVWVDSAEEIELGGVKARLSTWEQDLFVLQFTATEMPALTFTYKEQKWQLTARSLGSYNYRQDSVPDHLYTAVRADVPEIPWRIQEEIATGRSAPIECFLPNQLAETPCSS